MRHLLAAVLFLIFAADASAQLAPVPAVHTIDMTTIIRDQHDKPMTDTTEASKDDPQCTKCGPLTLGTVVSLALLTERAEDRGITAVDKARRAALAMTLIANTKASLTATQTALIKPLLNVWSPIVAMRAIQMIDPNDDLSTK